MADPYNIAFWFHTIQFLDGMDNWEYSLQEPG
jgi:hypothetical protein